MTATNPLAGRLALVTGVDAGGIGQEIALELARQGAAVVCHHPFGSEGADQAIETITAHGGRAAKVQGDLSNIDNCGRIVDEAAGFLGGLDILVNNAGLTERVIFEEITPEHFEKLFHINIAAQIFCAQRAVSYMTDHGGSILNLSSVHADAGFPGYTIYAATKGAVVSFTRQLAVELAPKGIRVNAIAPGAIEVPRYFDNPNYSRDSYAHSVPLGRVGTPPDIARTAAFLVSDAADYISGQIITIDGALMSRMPLSGSSSKK
jgi:glucose 1-dehydrogenase/3-oxoacyl-[acyl-carrier protein] reductase